MASATSGEDRDRGDAREPAAALCAAGRVHEGALGRRELAELAHLVELAARPEEIGAAAEALPLGGARLEAVARGVLAGLLVEPVAQRAPAADQRVVRELVARRARGGVARDDEPAAHQRLERLGGGVIAGAGELAALADGARAGRRDEPEHGAAGGRARLRAEPEEDGVRVAGEPAEGAAQALERGGGDHAAGNVARLPQLG